MAEEMTDPYDDITAEATPTPSPSDEEWTGGQWISDHGEAKLMLTTDEFNALTKSYYESGAFNALATKGRDTAEEIAAWLEEEADRLEREVAKMDSASAASHLQSIADSHRSKAQAIRERWVK